MDICDSEHENNCCEIAEVENSPENIKIPQPFETANVIHPICDEIPAVPVHTIQINPAAGADFPHSGLGVVIPPEVAAQLAKGHFNLVLEPIPSTVAGEPAWFCVKAVPISPTPPVSNEADCASETELNPHESESEDDAPCTQQRKKGLGSAHKGGKVRKYSLWTRISFTGDVRLRGMTVKEAKVKYNNRDRKRVAEWLKEYDNGLYSNLLSIYTQEESEKHVPPQRCREKDQVLEKRLVDSHNSVKEELYPITTKLLANNECLAHKEDFLGGPSSPNFIARVSDFLRHLRK